MPGITVPGDQLRWQDLQVPGLASQGAPPLAARVHGLASRGATACCASAWRCITGGTTAWGAGAWTGITGGTTACAHAWTGSTGGVTSWGTLACFGAGLPSAAGFRFRYVQFCDDRRLRLAGPSFCVPAGRFFVFFEMSGRKTESSASW